MFSENYPRCTCTVRTGDRRSRSTVTNNRNRWATHSSRRSFCGTATSFSRRLFISFCYLRAVYPTNTITEITDGETVYIHNSTGFFIAHASYIDLMFYVSMYFTGPSGHFIHPMGPVKRTTKGRQKRDSCPTARAIHRQQHVF